ncbi:hypothetical protein lerEdw1_003526 [Lerista edwardsae]|nr:hypothetical protein lerEdw1_003526 [Lerista edwardsae]
MGKAAAAASCSAGTRGLVSFLSAVPCLACKQPPPPPPSSASQVLVAMSLAGSVLEGLPAAPSAGGSPAPSASPSSAGGPGSDTYKGWLFKWTNYLKGYQRRWFVLSNGLLSYYRTQAEMAHTCRGTINLSTAHIDTEDSCNIVLSNGGRTYHLKASSEVERQRWVTALELAKAKAIRMRNNQSGARLRCYEKALPQLHSLAQKHLLGEAQLVQHCGVLRKHTSNFGVVAAPPLYGHDDSGDEEPASQSDKSELHCTLKNLSSKLEDLSTCNDLIAKHGAALQRSLSELENLKLPAESGEKIKAVNERATLFRITSNAMINACRDFLELAETHSRKWQRALQYEREQRIHLEETIEQLAKQHNNLERACRGAPALAANTVAHVPKVGSVQSVKAEASDEDEDTEYFDAMEDAQNFIAVAADLTKHHRRTGSNISGASEGRVDDWNLDDAVFECSGQPNFDSLCKDAVPKKKRRSRIPDKPNYSLNLWSIMKNCIGKELSKIPMPVNFNEPLSMLQRLTEDLEYHELLDKAVKCESSVEQMCFVAAFSVSSYSTTIHRTAKPFNPLLGETFELDRLDELGFRSLCEQVSHHPPAAAHHVYSQRGWTLWQEITIASKFRGKYLSIMPLGAIHLEFHSSGNHYVWRKVTSTVHNIIVGKLWIDQSGDIEIVNHKSKDKCQLKFTPYSYFSRDVPRKVTGVVMDVDGNAHYVMSGTWDEKMECAKIVQSSQSSTGSEGKLQKTIYQTLTPKVLWKKYPLPENAENMYFFSSLALTLNELEDGLAPTDSRLRPDQRLMENGRWDEANVEKQKLEEKQRAVRRRREAKAVEALEEGKDYEGYTPLWFERKVDPVTGELICIYKGGYWEAKDRRDWSFHSVEAALPATVPPLPDSSFSPARNCAASVASLPAIVLRSGPPELRVPLSCWLAWCPQDDVSHQGKWLSGEPLMKEPPALLPERSGSWAKDHCDYLLDSIDAQLSRLQAQDPDLDIKSSSSGGMASLDPTAGSSIAADLRLGGSGGRNGDAPLREDSSFWKEDYAWWLLARLPDLEGPAGGQSESDSVCTEDFATKFQEGLVDPCTSSRGEEDAFAAGVLSCDFGPLEGTTAVGSPRFLEGLQAAAGSHSVDLESRQDVAQPLWEAPQEVLDRVLTAEPLPQAVQDGKGSSESPGGKIPQLSQKCCKETGNAIENSAWILRHGPLPWEEKSLEIGKHGHARALLESPQRREATGLPFEWVQDARGNSNSPLLVEDLGPSPLRQVPNVTPRTTVADTGAPLRTDGRSCPQNGQADGSKSAPGMARLCTHQAPQNCVLGSGGEAREGRCCVCPAMACDANMSLKLALPEPATHTCVAGAPGGAKEPTDPGSEGGVKQRKSRATKAVGTRRPDGAPGLMAWGCLGTARPEPQHWDRLNKGPLECVGDKWVAGIPVKSFDDVTIDSDLDSVRTESVRGHFSRALGCQQASSRTRKLSSPQRDLLRDLGSSDAGTDEEEEHDGLVKFWRRSRPKKWTRSRGADPGWKGTTKGAIRICKDLDVGEETLSRKKAQIHEAGVSLCSLLQQKEHVAVELKVLQGALEESQEEARRLERHLEETRKQVEEGRADLLLLEYERDARLRELPRAEEELSMRRRQCSRYGVLQAEVSRLATEREALKTQVRHLEVNLSSLKLQLRMCQAEQETAEARTAQLKEVAQVASELDGRIQGLELRISALQKALSEKELELSRLRKTNSALEAEKEAQAAAAEGLKQEHSRQLQELQQRKVAESTAQAKADALQEQAATYQKDIEDLCKTIQAQDAELAWQKQIMQQQEQDLKRESEEMVQNSLLQEKRNWEEETRAALQAQREALEKQHLRGQAELQDTVEKERKSGLALQEKMAALSKMNHDLESQIRSHLREKQAAMEELRVQLQEEKAEGLRRLREELEQERTREREEMRTRLQQVEEDLRDLQARQSETAVRGQESQAHLEQADRTLAREAALVCQRLQDLLPKKAGVPSHSWTLHGSPGLLSSSRAVQALQDVSEEVQHYLLDLKQEMESQKSHVLQVEAEKELELRRLQEQLRQNSQSAVEALKERLVQEHMKDIATLQRNHATGDLALHQQLQEKDCELRAIRGNMAHWKEETARKLAHKFKEELDAELEKTTSQNQGQRMPDTTTEGAWMTSAVSGRIRVTLAQAGSPRSKSQSKAHSHPSSLMPQPLLDLVPNMFPSCISEAPDFETLLLSAAKQGRQKVEKLQPPELDSDFHLEMLLRMLTVGDGTLQPGDCSDSEERATPKWGNLSQGL